MPPSTIVAEIRCDNGHVRRLTFVDLPRDWVERHLALLDGSSPLYAIPVAPGSGCCECPDCGAPLHAGIVE